MLTESELLALMGDLESFRVERTISTTDTDKFREAICSFANDMPGSGVAGYLLVGVDDKTGKACGLKIIRVGPRRGVANEAQERILIERRTAASRTFDARPCVGSTLEDLATDLFLNTYRPQAIAAEVIAENRRDIREQMASLRLFDLERNSPTHAAILLFAKDPLQWLPHAYVQFVAFPGTDISGDPTEKRFVGDLLTLGRELEAFSRAIPTARPVAVSTLREETVWDFPPAALRELVMNAIAHRSYEAASPVRFYRFADRLEILSPGPLYGEATPANFPHQTSYRNPVVAEALGVLGFVNQYGRGVLRAQAALARNGSPEARFEFGDTFFGVTIPIRP